MIGAGLSMICRSVASTDKRAGMAKKSPPPVARLLGVDLGSKRIGVAVSDELGMLAHPVGTILSKGDDEADAAALVAALEREGAAGFVVGLPLNADGSKGPAAERSERFARTLRERSGREVILWDERLSTDRAYEALMRHDVSHSKRRKRVDVMAARMILQDYLDRKK